MVITGEVRCLQVIGGAFDARGEITDVRNYPDSFPGGFGYKGFTIRGSDGDKSSTGTDTCMRYFVTNPQLDGTCPTEEIVPEPQVDGARLPSARRRRRAAQRQAQCKAPLPPKPARPTGRVLTG